MIFCILLTASAQRKECGYIVSVGIFDCIVPVIFDQVVIAVGKGGATLRELWHVFFYVFPVLPHIETEEWTSHAIDPHFIARCDHFVHSRYPVDAAKVLLNGRSSGFFNSNAIHGTSVESAHTLFDTSGRSVFLFCG